MDSKFSDFYQELYERPLAEPRDEEDVKNILHCINSKHGFFDDEDENQLQKTNARFQKKMALVMRDSRTYLAKLTTTISKQLYDDPFRFFFELIQNADDAKYDDNVVPEMTFTVLPQELLVDINEKGFTLADVISVCATGESSKKLDEGSTGEKGFGFKAVFGIADHVHVQSGLWSFRFEHQRQDNGLGMIRPIWEQPRHLSHHIGTRFRLRYANSEPDSVDNLTHIWTQLETQHPSLLFALRKLRKISINFKEVEGRNQNICFEKSLSANRSYTTISSSVSGKSKTHFYRIFTHIIKNMPTQEDRPNPVSTIKIGLPISALTNGSPETEGNGQFIFAFLPIMRMPQLPFLIHADFILVGSRQSVMVDPWNRRLRDEIAHLFVRAVKDLVLEGDELSYEWPVYVPQSMNDFWESFPPLIHQRLLTENLFYARAGNLCKSGAVRIVPQYFKHQDNPILPDSGQPWQFLSERYKSSNFSTLKSLGVHHMSIGDALKLIQFETSLPSPSMYTRELKDLWHNSFLAFIQLALDNEEHKRTINQMRIVPVCVRDELEWWKPQHDLPPPRGIYWPMVVDERTQSDKIAIRMPSDLDIVVLHPDAADDPSRKSVYQSLGVCECPPRKICIAIEKAQAKSGTKDSDNLLRHFELLFWFSHKLSSGAKRSLVADTAGDAYAESVGLFMRSDKEYHAESLLQLAENLEFSECFLSERYQSSSVSTRSRDGVSWEQWLCNVAGVRWYPPLSDPNHLNELHWAVEIVRDENPKAFVPMIQNHWAEEYSGVCHKNSPIKQALVRCKVLCQHDGLEELGKTWFPNHQIVETAQRYGVAKTLPILALPGLLGDSLISQWPCLTELGVRWAVDLSFYRETLLVVSTSGESPALSVEDLGQLYKDIGDRATIEDQETLRSEFEGTGLVWDPDNKTWRTLNDCVWESRIPLRCKFVLTSRYDESTISGLFKVHLNVEKVTTGTLVDELLHLKQVLPSEDRSILLSRVMTIYSWLEDMVQTAEDKKSLRDNALIYDGMSGNWLKPSDCIWYTSIAVGNHVAIAALYSKLKEFFVTVLRVNTITDTFMMKQLAAAATKPSKTTEEIKGLMLSTSELLKANSKSSDFAESIDDLRRSTYLPCKTLAGEDTFYSMEDDFFVVDNQYLAEKFRGKLIMLDFAYEQLISLHELFRILRLDDRYLTRHVNRETSAETSAMDNVLTKQFRQCAYAISCCAILHRSSLFSNRNKEMYDELVAVNVHTSADISAKLVVKQGGSTVKVEHGGPSLIIKRDKARLLITLPLDKAERRQAMRSLLPGDLSELLNIFDSRGEKQIYRILNELDSGTDEILLDEDISRVSWLPETCRPAPPPEVETVGLSPDSAYGSAEDRPRQARSYLEARGFERVIPISGSRSFSHTDDLHPPPPPPYRDLPERLDHEVEAPDYWKVLNHVQMQAMSAGSGLEDISTPTTKDLINNFAALSLSNTRFDPEDHTSLFGHDDWLSKFLIGAAGELFAYEMLRSLTSNRLGLQHWQSKIRHFIQAHPQYSHVTRWTQRETADITYTDEDNSLAIRLKSKVVGDSFQEWKPDWLATLGEEGDNKASLEWLFEIKTTIGACETEFFMSPGQYELMRSLSAAEPHHHLQSRTPVDGAPAAPRRQRRPSRVYCIIRVYNLLSEHIGVRLFIDPWRLRETQLKFDTTDRWKVRSVTD